jgi:hypothetical protein
VDASGQAEASETLQRVKRRDAVACAKVREDAACLSRAAVGFGLAEG